MLDSPPDPSVLHFTHILQTGAKDFKQKPKAASEQFSPQKAEVRLKGERRACCTLRAQGLYTVLCTCDV